jgi:5-methylcytosine-specific restriction endonuclease McrBC regulatory subunit McrC
MNTKTKAIALVVLVSLLAAAPFWVSAMIAVDREPVLTEEEVFNQDTQDRRDYFRIAMEELIAKMSIETGLDITIERIFFMDNMEPGNDVAAVLVRINGARAVKLYSFIDGHWRNWGETLY